MADLERLYAQMADLEKDRDRLSRAIYDLTKEIIVAERMFAQRQSEAFNARKENKP